MGRFFFAGRSMEWSKWIVPVLAWLVIIAVVAGTGCMEKSYDFSSNGATVPVTPGEIIRISLGENPSTGYRWNVSLTGDLVITGEEYGSSNIIGEIFGLVGGGGTRTWHLEAGQAGGTQKFTAILKRPWMPTTGDEKTFEITFQVGTGRK